tara:strand:- start:1042 stop:1380 length:339 start_codon:yes stop_codon:yes gene_type:complete
MELTARSSTERNAISWPKITKPNPVTIMRPSAAEMISKIEAYLTFVETIRVGHMTLALIRTKAEDAPNAEKKLCNCGNGNSPENLSTPKTAAAPNIAEPNLNATGTLICSAK